MTSQHSSTRCRVLIVPLNWGLGHSTRLIPIIEELKKLNAEIFLGGSPSHQSLLTGEFNDLNLVKMPYLRIRLGKSQSQIGIIAMQIPILIWYVFHEHIALKKIIKKNLIDLVISDNCFGLWNQKVYSVFITHQLNIKLPRQISFLSSLINRINKWFISKYDACWVPDYEESEGFSGQLSHPPLTGIKTIYLGTLSRFRSAIDKTIVSNLNREKSLLILISGPERQRSIFENIIREQLHYLPSFFTFTIVRGLPGNNEELTPGWFNHLPSDQLENLIKVADYIICRSGYSTIMDLLALGRTALLVPTPGQCEQEYLAHYLNSKRYFSSMNQLEFDLVKAITTIQESNTSHQFISFNRKYRLEEIANETVKQVFKTEVP